MAVVWALSLCGLPPAVTATPCSPLTAAPGPPAAPSGLGEAAERGGRGGLGWGGEGGGKRAQSRDTRTSPAQTPVLGCSPNEGDLGSAPQAHTPLPQWGAQGVCWGESTGGLVGSGCRGLPPSKQKWPCTTLNNLPEGLLQPHPLWGGGWAAWPLPHGPSTGPRTGVTACLLLRCARWGLPPAPLSSPR